MQFDFGIFMIYTHYEGWLPEKTPTDVWKNAWLGSNPTTSPWAHDATPYPIFQLPLTAHPQSAPEPTIDLNDPTLQNRLHVSNRRC